MKILIASDIHGSEVYCEKLVSAFLCEKADKLLLLGDILYHGPRNDLPLGYNPKGVIKLLNEFKDKIICVRGNCDAEVDAMVLDFPIMDDVRTISDDKCFICATHGHHAEDYHTNAKGGILLCGHTHIPACEKGEDFLYLNPGSVSIPKENSPHSYMTYEDGVFVWKNLDMKEYMRYEL